jgi:hypothetical protein
VLRCLAARYFRHHVTLLLRSATAAPACDIIYLRVATIYSWRAVAAAQFAECRRGVKIGR